MSQIIDSTSYQDLVNLINYNYEMLKQNPLENVLVKSGIAIEQTVPFGSGSTKRRKESYSKTQYGAVVADGQEATYVDQTDGWEKDTVSKIVRNATTITKQMREEGKNREIVDFLTDLAKLVDNRRDLDLNMYLGAGLNTSYVNFEGETVDITTGDGVAPFSASHILKGSSQTYRNLSQTNQPISRSSLEELEELANRNTYDNLGNLMSASLDTLITTDDPSTVNTAREFLQSSAAVSPFGSAAEQSSGVVNVFKGRYKHVILPKVDHDPVAGAYRTTKNIAKKRMFFLADSTRSSLYLDVYGPTEFTMPSTSNNGEDILTKNWTFTTEGRHGSAMVGANWIFCSMGDGVAR